MSYITMMKLFLTLSLILCLVQTTNGFCFYDRYTIAIYNDVKDAIYARCQSSDSDLGMSIIHIHMKIEWQFCPTPWALYFCHFYWGSKQNIFDVYNKSFRERCSDHRIVAWKANETGFWFTAALHVSFPDPWEFMYPWK